MLYRVSYLGTLSLLLACAHAQLPAAPLDPGPQGIGSLLTAAPLARGASVEGTFPCRGSLYFRVDNVAEGTVLNIDLHTSVTAESGRFCHRGSFPDAHDQYTYTALGGCPENAMLSDPPSSTPSDAAAAPTTEQGPFNIRLWRLEDSSRPCVPGRYRLRVR